MKQGVLVCAVAILVTVATLPGPVLAINLEHYNLDSLVYLADRIVEGEIIGFRSLGVPVVDVRISRSRAGAGQAGETITVAAIDFFRKPLDGSGRTTPLTIGDRLFLFLIPARPAFAFEVPDDGTVLMPVASGLKLVVQEKTYSFVQYDNPGLYVANLPIPGRTVPTVSVTQLRSAIAVSLKKALVWREQFKTAPNPGDAAKLLALIRERRVNPPTFMRDAIGESAAWRLARLRNPKLMMEMLKIGLSSYGQESAAIAGLGTPEGRELLLQRIGDSSAPVGERRMLATIVVHVGLIYHSNTEIVSDNNARFTLSTDSDNSSYLTRIVRLSATVSDEQVTLALLSGIRSTGFSSGLPQVEVDMAKAVTELIRFHKTSHSARIRFAIETLIAQRSPSDFAKLQIPSTPVLSLATLDALETGKVRGTIFVSRDEMWMRDGDELTAIVLVLEAVDGSRTYVVPVERDGLQKARAGGGLSEGQYFQLPPSIRHGKYRVFFRYLAGNKTAAESYSFETSL